MGKQWDKAVPSKEVWKECLRVLKPGAFMFCMSLPRQDVLSRMIVNIEDAGFNVNYPSIYHTFASGFSKASNISKMVDKQAGVEREVIGTTETGDCRTREGWISEKTKCDVTIPATSEAKALEGFYAGYSPKPCVEIVIVAMKPIEHATYVAQALDNFHGCTNLDAGRIPFEGTIKTTQGGKKINSGNYGNTEGNNEERGNIPFENTKGRFAPHLLVEDDVFSCVRDRGTKPPPVTSKVDSYEGRGNITKKDNDVVHYGDSGSFSRYFSLDAWFDARIAELPEEVQKTFPFLLVRKASVSEKNKGLKGMTNKHPTVKPLKLIFYLLTIASREGDIVLDPYVGSGTTPVVAQLLNRNAIGIDISKEYCEIAYARLCNKCRQVRLDSNPSIIEKVGF